VKGMCVCLNYNNSSITTVHYCSSLTQQLPSSQQSIPSHSGQIINIRQSRSVSWIYCKLEYWHSLLPPLYDRLHRTQSHTSCTHQSTSSPQTRCVSKRYPETTKVNLLAPILC